MTERAPTSQIQNAAAVMATATAMRIGLRWRRRCISYPLLGMLLGAFFGMRA